MTEEKLIEMLWARHGDTITQNEKGLAMQFVMKLAFDKAIREALAAQRRGCANMYEQMMNILDVKVYPGTMDNILNAEPDTTKPKEKTE